MRQSYWKPQHEVFIRCMLKHEDPTNAYRTAYPKARPASARVGGHRLYNYPHIRQRIEPLLRERRAEAHKRALEEGAERERLQNERRLEIRRVLYKVVMRKLKRKRNFTVKGQIITIEDNPSINTVLNAMVLDIRLEAGYDNWPIIERRFARIMASLLPPEKREQIVTNSRARPIVTVISSEAKQSVAKRKTISLRQMKIKMNEVISREHAIGHTAGLQEISPCGRNDGLDFPEQPSDSELVNANEKTLFYEHSVTILKPKPIQAHPVGNIKTARVTRAVTKTIWPKIRETG